MVRQSTIWPSGRLVWLFGAVVLVVASVALRNAVAWYGHAVPGVLVDVGGSVSSIGLSSWQGRQLGLRFPQSIRPADAPRVHGSRARTEQWDAAIEEAAPRGQIDVMVEHGADTREVALKIHPMEPLAWWIYAGSSFIAGMLYAGSGLIALWASPRGRLARTSALFGINTGLFLFSLFDIHTQRTLIPVFFLCFSLAPATLLMLMLRLPDDVPFVRRFQATEPLVYALAVGLATYAIVIYFRGEDTRGIQSLFTAELGLGFLVFVIGFVVRYMRSRGEHRETLRLLFLPMVPPYAAFSAGVFLNSWASSSSLKSVVDLLAYPTALFAPLATMYAFVRHDLWGSRALLSRIATQFVLTAIACMAAIAAGAALVGGIGLRFRDAMAGAAVSTLLAVTLGALGRRVSDSTLFRSRAEYKPTIEQLSVELLTIASPAEVARAVERTVKRWLPCDYVALTFEPDGVGRSESSPEPDAASAIVEHRLQVEFGGRRLAWLHVGSKRGGALFTDDDVALLRTIANQGALAIAHAVAYQELEQRRQQQAQAWRGEREALVETVAAEIAHEIRYPINYFRSVFERSAQGETLDAEDVDVGREEVDRLERLVSGLKRMAAHRLERVPVSVVELCARAQALLHDALGSRRLQIETEGTAVVRCDLDQALQILVNLLSNGLEATGAQGSVGVTWEENAQGAELVVWDDGPGFVGEPARLFAPWFTTKARGTGLGLAITHRLVRAHGWNITAQRRDDRTAFVITVRKEDVVQPGNVIETHSMSEAEVEVA